MATVESHGINGNPVTVEEKFKAALNVIKSLPKNGSYKPSPSMMLKFYSYYKQATEGPCTKPKPWAWDVVNKAKWDAWMKLGDMTKSEAMENYVGNLKLVMTETPPPTDEQIVEAMPATDNVQEFIKILGNFYQVVDLDPPKQYQKFYKITSTPQHDHDPPPPLINGNGSTHHHHATNGRLRHAEEDSDVSENEDPSQIFKVNGDQSTSEDEENESERKKNTDRLLASDSEDEFCDTAENIPPEQRKPDDSTSASYMMVNPEDPIESDSVSTMDSTLERDNSNQDDVHGISTGTVRLRARGGEHGTRGSDRTLFPPVQRGSGIGRGAGNRSNDGRMNQHPGSSGGGGGRTPHSYSEVQDQIATTLLQLQQDMNSVLNRLSILEALTVGQQARRNRSTSGDSVSSTGSRKHQNKVSPSWWPFKGISPKTMFFIIVWPFVARWIMQVIRKRQLRSR